MGGESHTMGEDHMSRPPTQGTEYWGTVVGSRYNEAVFTMNFNFSKPLLDYKNVMFVYKNMKLIPIHQYSQI